MAQPTISSKLQFLSYRLATILKSFKALYTLPPEKVKAFVESYNIYNYDWANEEELIRDMGSDYCEEVKKKIVDWYSVLNYLCAIGQVEKMYIPPAIDLSKSIIQNQILIERQIAADLSVGSGKKILDIGCGRGRIAHHMASITGANVTGINVDAVQLESAKRYAAATGMESRCHFQYGDLNQIPYPFADGAFDGIYNVQVVFSLSKDPVKNFKEIHRLLKPGGKFVSLDWLSLDKYDPQNPHHADLMRRIKPLIGAVGTLSVKQVEECLKEAGFKIVKSENPSIDGTQAPMIERADKFFKRAMKLVRFLVKCKVLPAHFKPLFDRLTQDGEALTEADRMGIVTTTYYIVAQK